jgi:hypothetical protein
LAANFVTRITFRRIFARARRRHQACLEAALAKRFPDQIDDIAHPDLLENVGRPHRRRDADQKLVLGK